MWLLILKIQVWVKQVLENCKTVGEISQIENLKWLNKETKVWVFYQRTHQWILVNVKKKN